MAHSMAMVMIPASLVLALFSFDGSSWSRSSSGFPEATLSGVVTDAMTGDPIPLAEISSVSSRVSVRADHEGRYRLALSATSSGAVRFSAPGYRTVEEGSLPVHGGDVVWNVALFPESTHRDEEDGRPMLSMSLNAPSGVSPAHSSAGFSKGSPRTAADRAIAPWVPAGERYAAFQDNGFLGVGAHPLSTFSIDVDNASYANIRRLLRSGELPPPGSIRSEEMINSFTYDYPEPSGEDPYSMSTETGPCPWNPEHRLLLIGLRARTIDKASLPPSHIVFLIDVSGSMNDPQKLPLLQRAFHVLVDELREEDQVSLVVYAGAAGCVLPPTSGRYKDRIHQAIDQLTSGGSTHGNAGITLAYHIAERNFLKEGNNRVVLATDGDFNVGVTSNDELVRLVERKRKSGVTLSVLGFGTGNIRDDLMELLADKGDGNYSYIDSFEEARRVLGTQFAGTMYVLARDVKLQVEFNPAMVKEYRLIGYENRMLESEDFNDDAKDAGELGLGHRVTALYEIIPTSASGSGRTVDSLKYQISTPRQGSAELATLKSRYKTVVNGTSVKREIPIDWNPSSPLTDNLRLSAAIAEWAMLLRDSPHRGAGSFGHVMESLRAITAPDPEGKRAELLSLVSTSAHIHSMSKERGKVRTGEDPLVPDREAP